MIMLLWNINNGFNGLQSRIWNARTSSCNSGLLISRCFMSSSLRIYRHLGRLPSWMLMKKLKINEMQKCICWKMVKCYKALKVPDHILKQQMLGMWMSKVRRVKRLLKKTNSVRFKAAASILNHIKNWLTPKIRNRSNKLSWIKLMLML